MTRIYQPVPLAPGSFIHLDEKASHHLQHVLRIETGEIITILNGEGGEYEAIIRDISKKKGIRAEILSFLPREVESPLQIQLAQGIARGEKMDFIVQKAVELGINSIVPLFTERSTVRLDRQRAENRRQHWQAVAISACEQSGRNRIPQILPLLSLADWLPQTNDGCRLVLAPGGKPVRLEPSADHCPVRLLVGPEGGLTAKEELTAIHQGFIPWALGPRILRTETAALAALSVLQACHGDFGLL